MATTQDPWALQALINKERADRAQALEEARIFEARMAAQRDPNREVTGVRSYMLDGRPVRVFTYADDQPELFDETSGSTTPMFPTSTSRVATTPQEKVLQILNSLATGAIDDPQEAMRLISGLGFGLRTLEEALRFAYTPVSPTQEETESEINAFQRIVPTQRGIQSELDALNAISLANTFPTELPSNIDIPRRIIPSVVKPPIGDTVPVEESTYTAPIQNLDINAPPGAEVNIPYGGAFAGGMPFRTTGTDGRMPLSREEALFEQEVSPYNVFQQYLLGQPGYGQLSPAGRSALGKEFGPMETAFLTSPLGKSRMADILSDISDMSPDDLYDDRGRLSEDALGMLYDEEGRFTPGVASTFRDFIRREGTDLGLPATFRRFGGVADAFTTLERLRSPGQEFQVGFWDNPRTKQKFLQSVLPRVNPVFRDAFSDYFNRQFLKFQAATPEQPFVRALPQFKGILGVQ